MEFEDFLKSFKPEDAEGQWRYTERELKRAFDAGRQSAFNESADSYYRGWKHGRVVKGVRKITQRPSAASDGYDRQRFELWIASPPFEKSVARWPDNAEKYAWHGQYIDLAVELAWEAWEESRA